MIDSKRVLLKYKIVVRENIHKYDGIYNVLLMSSPSLNIMHWRKFEKAFHDSYPGTWIP